MTDQGIMNSPCGHVSRAAHHDPATDPPYHEVMLLSNSLLLVKWSIQEVLLRLPHPIG